MKKTFGHLVDIKIFQGFKGYVQMQPYIVWTIKVTYIKRLD